LLPEPTLIASEPAPAWMKSLPVPVVTVSLPASVLMVKSSPATLNVSGPAVPVSVVAMNKTPKKDPGRGLSGRTCFMANKWSTATVETHCLLPPGFIGQGGTVPTFSAPGGGIQVASGVARPLTGPAWPQPAHFDSRDARKPSVCREHLGAYPGKTMCIPFQLQNEIFCYAPISQHVAGAAPSSPIGRQSKRIGLPVQLVSDRAGCLSEASMVYSLPRWPWLSSAKNTRFCR
jgi:hypothetical protein